MYPNRQRNCDTSHYRPIAESPFSNFLEQKLQVRELVMEAECGTSVGVRPSGDAVEGLGEGGALSPVTLLSSHRTPNTSSPEPWQPPSLQLPGSQPLQLQWWSCLREWGGQPGSRASHRQGHSGGHWLASSLHSPPPIYFIFSPQRDQQSGSFNEQELRTFLQGRPKKFEWFHAS